MLSVSEELGQAELLPILQDLAEQAATLYDLPAPLSITLINLSENATYKVTGPDGRCWALRIHRDGYHSPLAIASELAWMAALRASAATVTPKPVPGRNGELLQILKHPCLTRRRHLVLFEWEAGREPGIGDDLSGAFESLGEVTARMHLQASVWQRPPWFTRFTWTVETALGDNTPHWGHWRNGIGVDDKISALFKRTVDAISQRLAAYGQRPDRFGLIHCDLRLANLLVDGDTVKTIDFDDCGFGWFMYDAATPLSFHEHEPQAPSLIDHWKTGYRRVMPLPRADEEEIPTFLMYRRILLVAWIGSRHETDLARSMGKAYTESSLPLCEAYLSRFG